MAANTWLGPTLPDEHAEPADKAIPARSNAICTVSAFCSCKEKKVVLGIRGALCPYIVASGAISRIPVSNRSRISDDQPPFSRRAAAQVAAAPKPAINGRA